MRLHEFRQKDFEFLKYLTTHKKVYRHIRNGQKWSNEKVYKFISQRMKEQQQTIEDRKNFYYIIQSNSGEELGVIGISYKDKKYSLTVFIDPNHHGRGVFSEALQLMKRRLRRYKPYMSHFYAQAHVSNKKMNAILNRKGEYMKSYNIGDIPVNEYKITLRGGGGERR